MNITKRIQEEFEQGKTLISCGRLKVTGLEFMGAAIATTISYFIMARLKTVYFTTS